LNGAKVGGRSHGTGATTTCNSSKLSLDSQANLVVAATCTNQWFHVFSEIRGRKYAVDIHRHFDDRRPDPVDAALVAVVVAQQINKDALSTGVGKLYAGLMKADELAAALAKLGVDEATQSAFAKRFEQAKNQLDERAQELDPRRQHMYLETPQAVLDARKAYYAKNSALYAKLDALEARAEGAPAGNNEDVVRDMNELRGEYLAVAAGPGARFDPFVVEITREIVLLHVAAKRDLLAQAESALLREPSAGRHLFPVEVGASLYRAMAEEHRKYEDYSRAKSSGADERALKARFGATPPLDVGSADEWVASDTLPDLAGFVEPSAAAWTTVSGIVRSVAPAPKGADGEAMSTVSFKDTVNTYENTACYETGKITGVTFEGSEARLNYETVCRSLGQTTEVTKTAPVTVPSSEVASVKPGENLLVMVDKQSRAGAVVRSMAAGRANSKDVTQVLQIRGNRFSH
jgi:hypothetical protein